MPSEEQNPLISPADFLGFEVGADRKLADWPEIVEYFNLLVKNSERIQTEEIGKSTEGNPFLVATISSPENLANLEKYREIQRRLADPRTITDELEAEQLISEGKVIVAVTCSIHASEVGATQMSLLLAHHLATSDHEDVKRILDNVILLLIPSLNPDGLIKIKEWYESSIGTNYEGSMPPFLYHKYTGHDNNRDWFMFTQAETKLVVNHCLNAWHPQILYDIHQTRSTGMRMILPPFIDPVGPNVDPIIQSEIAMLGSAIANELTSQGKPGVAVNVVYDAYSPSRTYQHYHAGIRILSEAASVRMASPLDIPLSQLQSSRGETPTQAKWNHPLPWKGGRWSLGDIVDYDFSATMACLGNAARYRDMWVRNFYKIGKNAVTSDSSPYAYLIPKRQRDLNTTSEFLGIMDTALVEIHEATESFQVDGYFYPEGTLVIKSGQPYWAFAKTMIEQRKYPDLRTHPDGPPKTPYDVTAHCLPIKMGVGVVEVKNRFEANMKLLSRPDSPKGKVTQRGLDKPAGYLLPPYSNASAKAVNKLLSKGANIGWAREPMQIGNDHYSQGTFIIENSPAIQELMSEIASQNGLTFDAVGELPESAQYQLHRPRIGLYKSHIPNVEEGWTRFVFEEYGFDYVSVRDKDVRKGNLNELCDAIVLPHQWSRHMQRGHHSSTYHPDYANGLGDEGAKQLRQFAESGGTIIAWDGAARYAIQHLELPVRNILAGTTHSDFYAPGSLLNIMLDTNHPVAYGMPNNTATMFFNGPAFDIKEGRVIGKYPLRNPLMSGLLIGAEKLFGRTSLASIPVGKGEVILMGFRVNFRAQLRGTYKLLFNSLYYSSAQE